MYKLNFIPTYQVFLLCMNNQMVPEDTIHILNTSNLFSKQGSLILEIGIVSYSNTYFFPIFYSTGENAAVYKPGGAALASNER